MRQVISAKFHYDLNYSLDQLENLKDFKIEKKAITGSMKKSLITSLFFVFLLFTNEAFSQIPELRTGIYQVNCKSIQSDVIEVEIWATKKPTKYRIERACRDAINANLYSTISSSLCGSQMPLLSSADEIQKFELIKKSFYTNGTWRSFVRNSTVVDQTKGHYIIQVDRRGLRKYLTDNKIITNLNKGF